MEVYCENDYCLYQKDNACTLDKLDIEFGGVCDECVLVGIPNDKLKELKEEQLKRLK